MSEQPAIDGYNRWLVGGAHYTPEALDRVMEIMRADALGRSDATGRFRPSMSGDVCPRKQMLSYRGVPQLPHDLSSMGFMVNGTFGHYRWQLGGLSEGFLTDIEVPYSNHYGVKGSGDGVITQDGSLFELKTTGSNSYSRIMKERTPNKAHVIQVTWLLLNSDTEWVSIVYEDRDYPQRKIEFRVNVGKVNPTYPAWRDEAVERLEMLNGHAEHGTLPDMLTDCEFGRGDRYRSCPWRKVCPTVS